MIITNSINREFNDLKKENTNNKMVLRLEKSLSSIVIKADHLTKQDKEKIEGMGGSVSFEDNLYTATFKYEQKVDFKEFGIEEDDYYKFTAYYNKNELIAIIKKHNKKKATKKKTQATNDQIQEWADDQDISFSEAREWLNKLD